MKKLLYITDQDEYVDHSFIAPLFEVYLKKYINIDIVYFTDFKSDFEQKDEHRFTIPSCSKKVLIPELRSNGVDMKSYDFVMVRNNIETLKHILKYRRKYKYKALYRFSFPKRRVKMRCDEAEKKLTLFSRIINHFKTVDESKLINRCDAFLPTSKRMHEAFLPEVSIPSIICAPAINPQALHPNLQHEGEEKHFIYAGTLDKVREFQTVLDAFSTLTSSSWKLIILTRDVEYAQEILSSYSNIQDHIEIHNAKTKDALLKYIAQADIGVALLPDMPIYTSATPVKIFDYYSSAVPCLMTDSGHTTTLFTDCSDAWFCDFTQEDITNKLTYLLSLSKEEVVQVGAKGQKRLLEVKNYETIAKTIADKLEAL